MASFVRLKYVIGFGLSLDATCKHPLQAPSLHSETYLGCINFFVWGAEANNPRGQRRRSKVVLHRNRLRRDLRLSPRPPPPPKPLPPRRLRHPPHRTLLLRQIIHHQLQALARPPRAPAYPGAQKVGRRSVGFGGAVERRCCWCWCWCW